MESTLTKKIAGGRRSRDEQIKLDDALRHLFESSISFNAVVGLKVTGLAATAVKTSFKMRPELVGHYFYGRLHGGVISTVLDATGGLALMVGLGEKHSDESADEVMHRFLRIGTIDLRIDYLRQGNGDEFVATAQLTRLGSRIASVQMALHNNRNELIATGAASYIVS